MMSGVENVNGRTRRLFIMDESMTNPVAFPLQILHEEDGFLAVNKPAGLLVHRTRIARDATTDVVSLLREQTGHAYHPCHRLDRATSGVLLLACDLDTLRTLNRTFAEGRAEKGYLALVRGWIHEGGVIDSPLKREEPREPQGSRPLQSAITRYQPLLRFEHPTASGPYASTRLTLCALDPETGRRHQLRRHLARLRHPVIGDSPHGDGRLNRWAREQLGTRRLFLHARSLRFPHPLTGAPLAVEADAGERWHTAIRRLEPFLCSS